MSKVSAGYTHDILSPKQGRKEKNKKIIERKSGRKKRNERVKQRGKIVERKRKKKVSKRKQERE